MHTPTHAAAALSHACLRGARFALLGGLLAGCTPFGTPFGPAPEGPVAFRQGYEDGCYSGIADFPDDNMQWRRKDEALYRSDADYKRGWDQGYKSCYDQESRHPKFIQDHDMGARDGGGARGMSDVEGGDGGSSVK